MAYLIMSSSADTFRCLDTIAHSCSHPRYPICWEATCFFQVEYNIQRLDNNCQKQRVSSKKIYIPEGPKDLLLSQLGILGKRPSK